MTWAPFGADPEQHATLADGTPLWMVSSLRTVFESEFTHKVSAYGYPNGKTVMSVERMREFDLASRDRPYADKLAKESPGSVFAAMSADERLRVLDWLIRDNVSHSNPRRNEAIEKVLHDGGSRWKVGTRDGQPGLEARVPQGVQDAADAAMARPGDAGRLLSEAWHAVYGKDPQPDLGYRKSVEAVEAVVIPLVMKNDATATLGKAIGQMRAQGDWKLPFIKEHAQNPSEAVVLGMLQALWSGHSDRHPGTPSYVPSTQEAAEAAVSLAVTIVNLFANGGVQRRR